MDETRYILIQSILQSKRFGKRGPQKRHWEKDIHLGWKPKNFE